MPNIEHDTYDTALICINGHVLNDSYKSFPQFNSKFCSTCGSPTICKCQNCEADIRGRYWGDVVSISTIPAPNFCHNCGNPFPWTECKLQSARDLINELSALSDDDKDVLTKGLDDLVKDSPQTTLAATRFKRIMAKAGKEIAESARQILIDIVSETAKKLIWPDSK